MLTKLLRKLRLGRPVFALLRPFIPFRSAGMSPEEALTLLRERCPDRGGSCLMDCAAAEPLPECRDMDIIIPAYNVERYLRSCLDSVLSQSTGYSFRVIVVDDGSTDGTAEILRDYQSDPRVYVRRQENRGFSGARNTGLLLSNAEYILFLDSDDLLCPGCLERMRDIAAQSGADIVESGYERIDADGRAMGTVFHKAGRLEPLLDCNGYVWGKLYRSGALARLRMPPGYWYEDSVVFQVLLPRLMRDGGTVYGDNGTAVCYRQNPQGISRSGRASLKSIDSLWITLSLHRDRELLGLENDQSYYEYILDMAALTYRRTSGQPEDLRRAVFAVLADFVCREFPGFVSRRRCFRWLEQALRNGDYGVYSEFCRLM